MISLTSLTFDMYSTWYNSMVLGHTVLNVCKAFV